MTDPKVNKKTESLTALKNANKHLTDLFGHILKTDTVLSSQASQIDYVANQCGDLQVLVYVGQDRKSTSLKAFLKAAATALNEARS
jgi:hypothetical protein